MNTVLATTLFTCAFLEPGRFNLHDRQSCTSIKKIIELFATVAREGSHFRGWEALAIRRKIIFAAFRSPFECNMDSFFFFLLFLFLCLVSCQEAETRVEVSLATSKRIFSAILFSSYCSRCARLLRKKTTPSV